MEILEDTRQLYVAGKWEDVGSHKERPLRWDTKQYDAMQEALTCEWLIEQGLMPDPSEFTFFAIAGIKSDYAYEPHGWLCEDKTK
jgi:hypothetical protein